MRTLTICIQGVSPYSQSRYHSTPKLDREIPRDYEDRTWRERLHVDDTGQVIIPPMALKNCLAEAAKFLSLQIPGKGKATYTKHFEAGLLIVEPIRLGIRAAEVQGEWLFVPADGRRGSGKRVEKCFPFMAAWGGQTELIVLDEMLTDPVIAQHLDVAGKFIGLGRFRPRNNGYYGRFEATIG